MKKDKKNNDAVIDAVVVDETTTQKDEKVETSTETTTTEHNSPLNDDLVLNYLDESLVYNTMSVPSASHHEYRMQTYIILWAKENGIAYDIDKKGNLYLTKGNVADGEFYPCVTAHMDTVQQTQILYAKGGVKLDVLTRIKTVGGKHKHEIYCNGFGIGGDDKAGVTICLNMFKYFDALKACFFVEEEVGCMGSKEIDMNKDFYNNWFGNVGYVIGYDSPDLNRAAHTCSGTKLMNRDFFEKNGLAELCAKFGLNDFRSEPFTDVVSIRKATEIICMNFGTGYYECHTSSEYCVLEDMDNALGMGIAIIEKLGKTEHKMKDSISSYSTDSDSLYFSKLNPKYVEPSKSTYNYGYAGYSGRNYYNEYHGSGTTKSNTTTPTTTKNDNSVKPEMIEYIVRVYDERIDEIKESVMAKCNELGIDPNVFESIFTKEITF